MWQREDPVKTSREGDCRSLVCKLCICVQCVGELNDFFIKLIFKEIKIYEA